MKIPRTIVLPVLLFGATASAGSPLSLDWMAGQWCNRHGSEFSEEHWFPNRGGLMLGVNRSVSEDGTTFEFLRIEFTGERARFVAQPGGAPPTTFELASSGPHEVSFANPQHDFPKRIFYKRDRETLIARIDDGTDNGQAIEFRWHR
ncbi:MAG TPA: DUF6265 family protein, partial [Steroidobacter sp.]